MKLSTCKRAVLIVGLCGLPVLSAKTLLVNNTPDVPGCPAEYATIQGGVNAAGLGDVVYVCAGTYNEQVVITQNITLAGQNGAIIMPSNMVANTTELYGYPMPLPAAVAVLVQGTSNVTIENLIIDGSNNGLTTGCGTDIVGIYYQNSGGTVTRNAIRYFELSADLQGCQVGLGIYADSSDGKSNMLSLVSNSIHDYQKDGIDIDTPTYGFTVKSNTVRGFGATGVIGQNGIEIDAATSGSSLVGNNVTDNLYICPPAPATCYAATGILEFANNVSSTSNSVTGADVGIYYQADNATISSNAVSGIQNYDGIFLQDDSSDAGSTIKGNAVTNAPYGIELYGASSNVSISTNVITEAAVGISNDNANAITVNGDKYFAVVLNYQNGLPAAGTTHKGPLVSRAR